MSSGHLLLSCAKRAATAKISFFAYLRQLPCALFSLILMTLTVYATIYPERKNTAVMERYQHSTTCAGDESTYTTGFPAPIGTVYPFSAGGARGML